MSLNSPLYVHWEVTNKCNHNCMYCYNYWRSNNKSKQKNAEINKTNNIYKKIIGELIKKKIYKVIVTGGEPLIVFDNIYPYLKQLSKNNIQININSNLTLINDKIAEKIKTLNIPVLVSLQSYDEKTTNELTQSPVAFKRIITGIKLAKKHKIGIAVNMVVSQKNIFNIYKTAKLAKELGASKFSASKACRPLSCDNFSAFSLTRTQTRYIFDELERVKLEIGIEVDSLTSYPVCLFDNQKDYEMFGTKRCSAGRNSIAIGVNGSIRPCPHLSVSYGDIFDGLDRAWKKMEVWRDYSYLPKKCLGCKYSYFCQGGCKAEVLSNRKKIYDVDPYADFSKRPDFSHKTNLHDTSMISANTAYYFPSNLFIRKETFGGLLYNGKSPVMIDKKMYRFIENNKSKKIKLQDFSKALGVQNDEAKKTVRYLLNMQMIVQ